MTRETGDLRDFAASVAADGYTKAVLLGMGGSSLAPEVLQTTFGSKPDRLSLHVLDTTHPDAILDLTDTLDLQKTLFIVASKSGSTIETMSQFRYFWDKIPDGRPLHRHHGPAVPASRNSARSTASVASSSTGPISAGATRPSPTSASCPPPLSAPTSTRLLSQAHAHGEGLRGLEGSRKPRRLLRRRHGRGSAGRQRQADSVPAAPDCLLRRLGRAAPGGIDGQRRQGHHPHRRRDAGAAPDLRRRPPLRRHRRKHRPRRPRSRRPPGHPICPTKARSSSAPSSCAGSSPPPSPASDCTSTPSISPTCSRPRTPPRASSTKASPRRRRRLRCQTRWPTLKAGDYLVLLAYLPRNPVMERELQALRLVLRDRYLVPTMLGFGPRYLHSTGQLHKGGPNSGVFILLTDDADPGCGDPGRALHFRQAAQGSGPRRPAVSPGRRPPRCPRPHRRRTRLRPAGAGARPSLREAA